MAPLTDLQRLDIQRQLEKRQSFKQGIAELTRAVCAVELGASTNSDLTTLFPLVARTHQLLKARHTNIDFWRTGRALFVTCQHLKFAAGDLAKLRQFQSDADAFLQESTQEAADAVEASHSSGSTGLPMTEAGILEMLSGPAPPPESHFDDAGPIIDENSERWRRAQVSGTTEEAATGNEQAGAGLERPRSVRQQRQDLQRQIMEGIQAVYSGMEAVSRGTEAIGRELEGVLELISARAVEQPPARPPTSKKVLAALPVLEASEERLREWGQGAACAVCMSELELGDQVQVLPCSHMYHPACVAPWFAKNNSCPMCRKELPTDDPHYEARKEREAEEEIERRGVVNSLRGGEHMYI